MKKKLVTTIALLGAVVFTAACGKTTEEGPTVTLPEYEGTEIEVEAINVTPEDIDAYIQNALSSATTQEEVTDRAIQNGDIVNIDYEGKKDGVAFEGGTAQGYDLTIGSGTFIPGFEEGLVGAKLGDTLDLDITFPEGYQKEELAGQPVVFTVKVNTIKTNVVPELTDELVVTLDPECKTVDEYKVKAKEIVTEQATQSYHNSIGLQMFDSIYKQVTVEEVPQDLLDKYRKKGEDMVKSYATMYGVEMEQFVTEVLQTTMEDFNKENEIVAQDMVKEHLVWNSIAKKEGIEISEQEIKDFANENYQQAGYASGEEYLTQMGNDEIRLYLISTKAMKVLEEKAVVKEK